MGFYPWFSMWIHPKETMKNLVQNFPSYGVSFLVFTLAIENLFYLFNFSSMGLRWNTPFLVILAIALAPFYGYIWLGCLSNILHYFARILQGTAPLAHIKAALAWSQITALGILFSWIAILFLEPEEAFIQVGGGNPWLNVFHFLNFGLAAWSIFLTIFAVCAIEKFSFLRSLTLLSCGWLVFSIPSLIIFSIFLIVLRF